MFLITNFTRWWWKLKISINELFITFTHLNHNGNIWEILVWVEMYLHHYMTSILHSLSVAVITNILYLHGQRNWKMMNWFSLANTTFHAIFCQWTCTLDLIVVKIVITNFLIYFIRVWLFSSQHTSSIMEHLKKAILRKICMISVMYLGQQEFKIRWRGSILFFIKLLFE